MISLKNHEKNHEHLCIDSKFKSPIKDIGQFVQHVNSFFSIKEGLFTGEEIVNLPVSNELKTALLIKYMKYFDKYPLRGTSLSFEVLAKNKDLLSSPFFLSSCNDEGCEVQSRSSYQLLTSEVTLANLAKGAADLNHLLEIQQQGEKMGWGAGPLNMALIYKTKDPRAVETAISKRLETTLKWNKKYGSPINLTGIDNYIEIANKLNIELNSVTKSLIKKAVSDKEKLDQDFQQQGSFDQAYQKLKKLVGSF